MQKSNRLAKEKSPYLLQHRDNPIHWFAWGEEALKAAEQENKPIFLSIGYSTCYWCHVMEKDSFEQEEVANVLNRDFICIKVDREERPDVDSIYMSAVTAMTGHGGWPLSVFLTPQGKPFYGGTYFPRPQFLQILARVTEVWKEQPKSIHDSAEQLTHMLEGELPGGSFESLTNDTLRSAFEKFRANFDSRFGGFSQAPKFPPSMSLMLLLRLYRRSKNEAALMMAVKTLEQMARGGLYDHLGSGFHRYSTDERWLVPHFEKMLYDNAQLSLAYLEAYQLTKKEMFLCVATEVLDYILRDMTSPEGGFYSAEDAGEVGKEGEFYVWEERELKTILNDDEFAALAKLYGVTASGNFEDKYNIFNLQSEFDWQDKRSPLARQASEKLFAARERRERPRCDDKILTAWNGLTIWAMSKGYEVTGEGKYLSAAIRSADFICKNLRTADGKLLRRYRDGEARYSAYVDDYAFFMQGLLALYQAGCDEKWLRVALELQHILDEGYWDEKAGGYYFTSGSDKTILSRKKEFFDGAEPAGNSIALLNLFKLHDYTFEEKYRDRAKQLLAAPADAVRQYPTAFAALLIGLDYFLDRSKEIVIVSSGTSAEADDFREFLRGEFLPNTIIAVGKPAELGDQKALAIFRGKALLNDKATFYICENGACQLPTNDSAQAKKLLTDITKLDL